MVEAISDHVGELKRIFYYSFKFYTEKSKLLFLFSIPFLISLLLLWISAAPTYAAIGAVFLRTGSMPQLSMLDLILMTITYIVSIFIISDTIVNINLLTFSKRTLTNLKNEVLKSATTHAVRLFYIFIIMALSYFLIQLITFDTELRGVLYPLFIFIISYLTFFVPPALVMDNCDTLTAIKKSFILVLRKPILPLAWFLTSFIMLAFLEIFSFLLFPYPFSVYFIVLVNSLLFLPFLIIMQTQMYMEKYPLAR